MLIWLLGYYSPSFQILSLDLPALLVMLMAIIMGVDVFIVMTVVMAGVVGVVWFERKNGEKRLSCSVSLDDGVDAFGLEEALKPTLVVVDILAETEARESDGCHHE